MQGGGGCEAFPGEHQIEGVLPVKLSGGVDATVAAAPVELSRGGS